MTRPTNGRRIECVVFAAGRSTARPIRATAPDAADHYPPSMLPPAQRRALAAGARPSALFGDRP